MDFALHEYRRFLCHFRPLLIFSHSAASDMTTPAAEAHLADKFILFGVVRNALPEAASRDDQTR
ncbi:hypothetical protein GGF31_007300 [Allomyces arbusculus]|nr:hypothetical protein GGF31_007300 [Allomyces arbusculus]